MSIRRWLARLCFSLLILAFALGWTAREKSRVPAERGRASLFYAMAAVCLVAGVVGVRQRHAARYDASAGARSDLTPRN